MCSHWVHLKETCGRSGGSWKKQCSEKNLFSSFRSENRLFWKELLLWEDPTLLPNKILYIMVVPVYKCTMSSTPYKASRSPTSQSVDATLKITQHVIMLTLSCSWPFCLQVAAILLLYVTLWQIILTWIRLKGRYMFGSCQRPVFSLGVSHHGHEITSLWKFGLNRSSKLRRNYERKNTPFLDELVYFQIGIKKTSS